MLFKIKQKIRVKYFFSVYEIIYHTIILEYFALYLTVYLLWEFNYPQIINIE
jgi:hypothetical protein